MMETTPASRGGLNPSELESLLERLLDPVLSTRRSVSDAAGALAVRDGKTQQFVLHWLKIICATNAELGYRFVCTVDQALSSMDDQSVEAWAVNALDTYDAEGLYPASAALADVTTFARRRGSSGQAVRLDSERQLLERYLQGLSGRTMHIRDGQLASTDTQHIVLPGIVDSRPGRDDNRLLLKAMATQLWAMNRFGTFRRKTQDSPGLNDRLATFRDRNRAEQVFYALETERLNACIARELPGLGRQLSEQFSEDHVDATWQVAIDALASPRATVEDSLNWTRKITERQISAPARRPWQGSIDFTGLEEATRQRLDNDKDELQQLLQELIDKLAETDGINGEGGKIEIGLEPSDAEPQNLEISINGQAVEMSGALRDKLDAILQDLESIPEDWLRGVDEDAAAVEAEFEGEPAASSDPVFYYDEWDFQRKHYRKNWCTLFERSIAEGAETDIDVILEKHHGVVVALKQAFERLRDDQRTLRRQPEGEDIDLDAIVDAHSDRLRGLELPDRLFMRTHRNERDIAVMFMVDLSGSTKGWIVDAEREALVLLCEALEVLGDRYGIYGFSGMTRKRCELIRIKQIGEPYNSTIRRRIAGIKPRDYTRMGVTIRHLTSLLAGVEARTRLLITLSDGKPDDYDGYRGDYGIEDTRQALIEARNEGIHPFCITIDRQGSDYLPHMYGAVNYTVVDDVKKLPREVSEVYWRLTR